jgi:glucosamine--fructose-6-phosphate aminotransferase (isomerizing)
MLALYIARLRDMSFSDGVTYVNALKGTPDLVREALKQAPHIKAIAKRFAHHSDFLFLGRLSLFPLALEGALKLKEISYIHAEGYPAAEMKHGPIALIDSGMPVVFVATKNSQYEKVLSNIAEVRSRGGHVIAVATEGDDHIRTVAEDVFYVPDVTEMLQPLVTVVPLQLLAYHAAVMRGKDVDKPRNLAKSVTVE